MPQGSPINDIMQMRQQGLSNNQIIQNLQRQGYTNTQIFDAMNQVDTKMAVEGAQPLQQEQQVKTQELFTQPPQDISNSQQSQESANVSEIQQQPQMTYEQTYEEQEMVKIEELVEAIIEEKWSELVKDVDKIVTWKNKVEQRITEIETNLETLKQNFSDLNKAVLGKINEYDKHILEIGSDIKAMEKVFSKVLPVFTENVNELSRITNKLKSKGDDK